MSIFIFFAFTQTIFKGNSKTTKKEFMIHTLNIIVLKFRSTIRIKIYGQFCITTPVSQFDS